MNNEIYEIVEKINNLNNKEQVALLDLMVGFLQQTVLDKESLDSARIIQMFNVLLKEINREYTPEEVEKMYLLRDMLDLKASIDK
ncbi:hypothetical protein ACMXZI_17160 [Bacillus subtilis]|uniref:Uncharacterized protein n=2 Tax=Bacillus subtilis TaxID=1423 RepID=A0A0D1KZA2_BACIU|nr:MULTISPECIES: hypothetical protein [Bacillus]AMK72817.1 hypothetical protein AWV81_12105 [Bacillus subtilis subsp. natto]AOR98676.1 hypothetical protein BSBS38_02397 [Bacillus subtilis]AOS68422.1 hypothetical protein A4A60_12480 [Bacillus subtilis]API42520.1 hypothetical protein BSR08_08375 [Bacillus subtilis]API94428.1 hypothetical protein BKP58_00230 [Bacillus subtilis]